MQERSVYEVYMYLNIKLVRIFSSGAYLGEVEIEKSTITLKYATDAERIYHGRSLSFGEFLQIRLLDRQTECITVALKCMGRSVVFASIP